MSLIVSKHAFQIGIKCQNTFGGKISTIHFQNIRRILLYNKNSWIKKSQFSTWLVFGKFHNKSLIFYPNFRAYNFSAFLNHYNNVTSKDAEKITTSNNQVFTSNKDKKKIKTDFSKTYTENIYITPVRAMEEFILKPSHLEKLKRIKRRSPYPEQDDIIVYSRGEVEKKAIEIWGSLEKIQKEKRKSLFKSHVYHSNVDLFGVKQAAQTFQKQKKNIAEKEEKPFIFKASELRNTEKSESIFKKGSGKVVVYAVAVNTANAAFKCAAWLYSGSHSMFSEFIHSLADTINQLILALGIHQSLKKPDMEHPYGWASFPNVASLISGVGIFCVGAGLSWYHGIMGLVHPSDISSGLPLALLTLSGSLLTEGSTLVYALREIRNTAKVENVGLLQYVWRGCDPSTNVVLLEDLAAVIGVVIASGCLSLSYFYDNPLPDAIGSLLIGTLLGGVASFIIYTNTNALVGRSITFEKRQELMKELENDRMIRALHDVKATEMGGRSIRFKAEVDFDGREITRLYLEKQDLDALFSEITKFKSTEEVEIFMLKHGESIVDTLGGEVDRIEKILKKKHPEIRHVDLEQL